MNAIDDFLKFYHYALIKHDCIFLKFVFCFWHSSYIFCQRFYAIYFATISVLKKKKETNGEKSKKKLETLSRSSFLHLKINAQNDRREDLCIITFYFCVFRSRIGHLQIMRWYEIQRTGIQTYWKHCTEILAGVDNYGNSTPRRNRYYCQVYKQLLIN